MTGPAPFPVAETFRSATATHAERLARTRTLHRAREALISRAPNEDSARALFVGLLALGPEVEDAYRKSAAVSLYFRGLTEEEIAQAAGRPHREIARFVWDTLPLPV